MNLGQEQQQLTLLTLQQQVQHHNHHNHHQQQYYQKQQQQPNTSMALMSSGEYVNFKPINTIATTIATSAESAQDPIPLSNTALCTEMTIPMDLPTPPLSETLLTPFQAVLSTTAPEITTNMQTPQTTNTFETMGVMTSSFKTPLLPMPTLEDIEDGVIYDQQQQQQLQQQQQQIIQTSQIPTGILKYPTMPATTLTQSTLITQHTSPPAPPITATTTTINTTATLYRNTAELNLPLGLVADCASSTVVSHDVATLTTTAPTATIGGTRHKYGALKTTADINNRSISSSCTSEIPISDVYAGIVKSTMPEVTSITTTTTIATATTLAATVTTIPSSTTTIKAQGLRLKSSGAASNAASNIKLSQHQRSTSTYCCACFAKNPNDTHSTSDAKTKKRKRQTQTLWSAFITNVGICALLLAYTFLGAFIFLTIEGEDLYQQQRTLASTKRTVATSAGGRMLNTSGRRDYKASPGNDVGHVYAAQPQQHIDNGTLSYGGYVATSATDSTSAASTLEGVVMAINANGETVYGWDADSDDSNSPQMALSAQTSDVRQRTIENIWDITVSLNILYKENWTKLAAMEIAKFQDQLVKRLNEDAMVHYYAHDGPAGAGNRHSPATEAVLLHSHNHLQHEWNFAKAFFYALTVLTTIGYGHIAPRTTLSRMVTLLYAIFGIPLTLVYLSSTGGILAKVAREVFSKALCCCLCSNCGYCCYDEKRMAEKERRMKRKRQQEELRKQQAGMQEPYYVRTGSGIDNFQLPDKIEANTPTLAGLSDIDSLSMTESHGSMHGLSILAPILLCLSMMVIYIAFGAVMLYHLENWPLIDGVYFCFMSLSTIGFGDMLPGMRADSDTTTWFCSIYIMSGMALTAMCFNVIHDEIVHRIKIVVEFKKNELTLESDTQQSNYYVPP